ncbi:hypothetical protein NXW94_30595 [Bacteroides ovatus]|nr:hypothetical protein [Bacteroides ovatus]
MWTAAMSSDKETFQKFSLLILSIEIRKKQYHVYLSLIGTIQTRDDGLAVEPRSVIGGYGASH